MKIPLIGNAFSWLLGHVRLAIEYALIAAVVALGAYVLWQKKHSAEQDADLAKISSNLTITRKDLSTVVKANEAQDSAINELRDLRAKDSLQIQALQGDIQHADATQATLRSKLTELEKNNARAKALLDTAIDPDVGCVLDGTPCPAKPGNQHPS